MDRLPSEILLAIADRLDNRSDINALVQTNRRFSETLNEHLYRHDALFDDMDALYWAAKNGSATTARLSINASSIVRSDYNRMYNINHALYDAAELAHFDVISCLLEVEGANPNFELQSTSSTALSVAVREGHTAIVKLLLSAKDTHPNPKHSFGKSPLSIAAYRGFCDIVNLLLEVPGIYPNIRYNNNRTPFFYAVLSKSPEMVSCFLHRSNLNIDINIEDRSHGRRTRYIGRTPLIVASQFASADVVDLLLAVPGIAVNHADHWGKTALHFAAELGTEDIVRSLLKHNADPDPKDQENETPLFLASKNGRVSIVRLLLEAGANPNHICDNQVHPLGAARTEGHSDVAQVLRDFGKLDLNSLGPIPRNWNAGRGKLWRERTNRSPDDS